MRTHTRIALVMFVFLLATAFRLQWNGVYTPGIGMIVCSSHRSCVHEVGHKLDDQAGWISRSPEYRNEIQVYMIVATSRASDGSINPDKSKPFQVFAFFMNPGEPDYNRLREFYATMFEQAGGQQQNMPPSFQRFYNWPLAQQYLRQYAQEKP